MTSKSRNSTAPSPWHHTMQWPGGQGIRPMRVIPSILIVGVAVAALAGASSHIQAGMENPVEAARWFSMTGEAEVEEKGKNESEAREWASRGQRLAPNPSGTFTRGSAGPVAASSARPRPTSPLKVGKDGKAKGEDQARHGDTNERETIP